MKTLILLAIVVAGFTRCATDTEPAGMIDKTTVKNMDLDRYLGTWYEIARFPNSFEKGLVGVTATYRYRKNGKIEVLNQGFQESLDGSLKKIKGKAKLPDENEPSRLKVSFFLFFYSDYLVLELDQENYQWAMVGSSSDNYLWFLCRQPQMDEELYAMLLERALERGYDVSRLEMVPQNVGPAPE